MPVRSPARALAMACAGGALLFAGILAFLLFYRPSQGFFFQRALGFQVLADGRVLVTDGGGADWSDTGSKVFMVDRQGGVSRLIDDGLAFAHGAILLGDGDILVPDTNHDRLVAFAPDGSTRWSSEDWPNGRNTLSDGTKLDYPNSAQELPNGRLLVSVRYANLVAEIDRAGMVFRTYRDALRQHAPRRLPNGNTLIADSDRNRVIEIDQDGTIVWECSKGLAWPRYATRLANGNTLIADSNHDRIVEVTRAGDIVFEYGDGQLAKPFQVEELPGGTLLIADAQHGRLVEIDRNKRIVWQYKSANPVARWLALPTFIENGGAERVSSDGMPASWIRCDLLAPDTGDWFLDTERPRSGRAALGLRGTADPGMNKFWGQYVKWFGSKRALLTCRIRTEGVAEGAGVSLNFIDARGGVLGGVNSKTYRGDTDWTDLRLLVRVPRGTVALGVTLNLVGPGAAWWDDVWLW